MKNAIFSTSQSREIFPNRPAETFVRRTGRAGVRRPVRPQAQIIDRSADDVIDVQVSKRSHHEIGMANPDKMPIRCVHNHEWVVFSTALKEGWLMLQCVECGAMGTIDDPSTEEWSAAFLAPSRPYRWHDLARVNERNHAAPRVIRTIDGPGCDCHSRRSLPESTGYERVPDGIWITPVGLSGAEKAELGELAEFVARTDLCSHFLPIFVRSCEARTGLCHSDATHTILDRIERWDAKGLHCSPQVVARIIREFAAQEPG